MRTLTITAVLLTLQAITFGQGPPPPPPPYAEGPYSSQSLITITRNSPNTVTVLSEDFLWHMFTVADKDEWLRLYPDSSTAIVQLAHPEVGYYRFLRSGSFVLESNPWDGSGRNFEVKIHVNTVVSVNGTQIEVTYTDKFSPVDLGGDQILLDPLNSSTIYLDVKVRSN